MLSPGGTLVSITVHMFVDGVREPSELIREGDPDGVERWTQEPRLALDFRCVAVGTFQSQDRPMWSRMLDGYFDVDWRSSVSTSVVLLAYVADRWFAVTFGYGRHLLRPELLVADFGIRVTGNLVPPNRVRSLASVRLDAIGRRTARTTSIPTTLGNIAVDLDDEWVRSLGGATDGDLTRGMTGSQALAVDLGPERRELKHLHELLGHLGRRYHATDYREHFPFIDLVVPLHPRDARVPELDAALERKLPAAGRDVGIVAPDSQPGDQAVLDHQLRRRRGGGVLDRLGVLSAIRETEEPLSLPVRAVDGEGRPVGRNRTLRDFLSAEVTLPDGELFVLVESRWFRVDADRLAELDRRLSSIQELGHRRFDPPPWFRRDDEQAYNRAAAEQTGWCLMDRRNYRGADRRRDQVEVCDLMTPTADMVCIKRLRSSSALSHLFSQGSVSAKLYQSDRSYRTYVRREFSRHWPTGRWSSPTVVYAIGTDRVGTLHRVLPFFSRVNLANHATIVKGAGLDLALARIAVTTFRDAAVPTVPEQPVHGVGQLGLFE